MARNSIWLGLSFLICLVLFGTTPPANAQASHQDDSSIEYSGYIELGGIDQWITIRSSSADNPILLVVHGGPGDPLSPFAQQFEAYEDDFTVVQWDQRGAGHTYEKNGAKTPDANLAQVARDGVELAEYLIERFDARKIMVLGHSWGSVVAMKMVQLRPDVFSAYVGTGQVSSAEAMREAQTAFVRAVAEVRGDKQLVENLSVIATLDGSDPDAVYANLPVLLSFNRAMRSHLNPSDTIWLDGLQRRLQNVLSKDEIEKFNEGMNFSGGAYLNDTLAEDLFTTATEVNVPVYVIQGQDDLFTPTAPAVKWFEQVKAPDKKLWIIENAGHFALLTHQDRMLDALRAIASGVASD